MKRIKERLLEFIKTLVETPTLRGEEEKLFPFLKGILKNSGFKLKEQKISTGGKNLLGERGGGRILFCAHLDVFPPYHLPQPFSLGVKEDKLRGRGVCDCKGQIGALLLALELTREPCQVAFVADEEETGKGSEELEVSGEVKGAVVLEPTGGEIVISHTGSIEFEAQVFGKSAHGSLPQRGENAIEKAFKVIKKLKNLPFLKVSHPLFPPSPLFTLGKIEGGEDPLMVPEICRFWMDMRLLPGVRVGDALSEVKKVLEEERAEFKLIDSSPPVEIDRESPLVKLVKEAHLKAWKKEPSLSGYPSWTDGVNLIEKGIPAVVYGAGDLGIAHSSGEKISLGELLKLSQVLVELISLGGRL